MLKVAICDDQALAVRLLELYLERYQQLRGGAFAVEKFISSAELVHRLRAGEQYDLFILDMVMPRYNGVEVGRVVREQGLESAIIYSTAAAEFALDAIGVHPEQYLLKPVDAEALYAALDAVLEKMGGRGAVLTIKTSLGVEALPWDQIVCVEHAGRIARVHTTGGIRESVYLRSSFQSLVEPLLGRSDFVQTHKSYLANLLHARALQGDALLADTGMEIPISRRHAAEVRLRYLRYCGHRPVG